MKKLIRSSCVIFFAFFLSFELLSFLSLENNRININDEGYSFFKEEIKETVYFIGDSYASTNYAKDNYPVLFRNYFKSRKWNFIDLSKGGTDLEYHKTVLDSISKLDPKLIIYFYNISDIVSLNENILIVDENDVSTKENNGGPVGIFKYIYVNSASILFFKKSMQYLSLIITDRWLPGTPAYLFPKETVKKRNDLEKIFNSINAENVFILINTPFNAGDRPRQWEQYEMFLDFSENNDYELIQAVDIIDKESDNSISFRNGHPSEETIKTITSSLIKKFEELD